MSGKLPKLTGAEVIQALEHGGFAVMRNRSSHYFLRHTTAARPWFRHMRAKPSDRD